jgi:hypothetical protein
LLIHVCETSRIKVPKFREDLVEGRIRNAFRKHMKVVVKLAQQEVFFDGDLVHPALLLVGPMSFPLQANEQRSLQRAQQKIISLEAARTARSPARGVCAS